MSKLNYIQLIIIEQLLIYFMFDFIYLLWIQVLIKFQYWLLKLLGSEKKTKKHFLDRFKYLLLGSPDYS
jgi:hypothetical protein